MCLYVGSNKEHSSSSSSSSISTGVPHGPILGPLLFLIYMYMNDIPDVSKLFKSILYADDISLLNSLSISLNSYDPDIHTINVELSNNYDWLAENKLSLNLKKTKYMYIYIYICFFIITTRNYQITYHFRLILRKLNVSQTSCFRGDY